MADYLKSKAPNAVIFDTTAAEPVSEMYATWLKKGVHVVCVWVSVCVCWRGEFARLCRR